MTGDRDGYRIPRDSGMSVVSPSRDDLVKELRKTRAIAIVRGGYSVAEYGRIAAALSKSGLTTVEFTIEQPHALDAIRELTSNGNAELWLGAGTVRSGRDAERALDAGARYLISPGFVPDVARVADQAGVVYLPGVLTPSEVEMAVAAGCTVVKLFPAKSLGPSYLEAIAAPLTGVEFIPTGGVNLHDAHEYLTAGALAVGVGGSLVGSGGIPADLEERTRRLLEDLGKVRPNA